MKVKSGVINNALQVINELSEKPIKISLAAKFLRLMDDLQRESNYIEKQRRDIITKYGDKDENGELIVTDGNVRFSNENMQEVQNELNELFNFEVDITDRMITEEELEMNDLELTLNQLSTLKYFLHKNEIIE